MARTTPTVAFNAIEVKGSLIPDSLLDQVAHFKAKQQDPRHYGLEKNERVNDRSNAKREPRVSLGVSVRGHQVSRSCQIPTGLGVTSATLAPFRWAARAASTPACPPPTTTTDSAFRTTAPDIMPKYAYYLKNEGHSVLRTVSTATSEIDTWIVV